MKVFLSWSGARSKHLAEAFKEWLPVMLQAIQPWISSDIEKGSVWDKEIQKALNESKACIIFLTSDNLHSEYIHYEAGAVANFPDGSVKTFLYDISYADVKQPLARFQNTDNTKEDIFKLTAGLNSMLKNADETSVDELTLKKTFERNWVELKELMDNVPLRQDGKSKRLLDDKIDEILNIVRRSGNSKALDEIEKMNYQNLVFDQIDKGLKIYLSKNPGSKIETLDKLDQIALSLLETTILQTVNHRDIIEVINEHYLNARVTL